MIKGIYLTYFAISLIPISLLLFFINENYYGGALVGFSLGLLITRLLVVSNIFDDMRRT